MRIVLVETTSTAYRANPLGQMDRVLEPLGIASIGATVAASGHEVTLIHQLTETNEEVLGQILDARPVLVGLSCMTYAYPDTLELAEAIKAVAPSILIVLGGYHVPGMETAPTCFDFVINGEGEASVLRLTEFVDGDGALSGIPGLRFVRGTRHSNPIVRMDVTALQQPIRLDRSPYRSLSIGENMPDTRIACLIAGRGCPYRCDFCCTPLLYPGNRLFRPAVDVVDEMEALAADPELRVNNFNFRDETFAPGKQASYVDELCGEIFRRRLKVSWRVFANVGDLSDERMAMMAEAGCHMIFFGIESHDRATLKLRRKNFRDSEKVIKDIHQAQRRGIFVRGGYIVGHETDTIDAFEGHAHFLRECLPDELYISWLTPFPGTELYNRVRGRLLTHDFRKYDCEHPIVDIGIPAEELQSLRTALYASFYGSAEWRAHLGRRRVVEPHRTQSIDIFVEHTLRKHGIGVPPTSFETRIAELGDRP